MELFSPLTRRIVALGLLVLAALLLLQVVIVPLFAGIADGREELRGLRGREAALNAAAARSLPAPARIPPGIVIHASRRLDASEQLGASLERAAAIAGVTLSRRNPIAPAAEYDPLLALDVRASGSEASLLLFVAGIERGKPLIRFRSWELHPGTEPDQPMTFNARASAAWER